MEAVGDGPVVRFGARRLQDIKLFGGQALQASFCAGLLLLIFRSGGQKGTCLVYSGQEQIVDEWLLEKIVGALFDDLDDSAHIGRRRRHDQGDVSSSGKQVLDHLASSHVRQLQVDDRHAGREEIQGFDKVAAIGERRRLEVMGGEYLNHMPARVRVAEHDE